MISNTANESRLSVMNFLSEAALDYPAAISFASGRPAENFFAIDAWLRAVSVYQHGVAATEGADAFSVGCRLAQYGRTSGKINDVISVQIAADHDIIARPEQIVVTSGCQEAIALCLQALCATPQDVALARNPTYIGVTGAADFARIPLVPVNVGDEGFVVSLRTCVTQLIDQGRRPRVLYLIPEFDNPTGEVLTIEERQATLDVCSQFNVVVLEDNPYGMFRFEGEALPAMAALDRHGCVIHLGTYSKTICPAVRVGFAVLPRTLFGDSDAVRILAAELSERKSFLTVNTSQLNQAMVAGILQTQGGTLENLIRPALEFYRLNRDVLLGELSKGFQAQPGMEWNTPQGGFFLTLHLPFEFGRAEMMHCAASFGVLITPMTFFSLDDSQRNQVRISYSNLKPQEIVAGVRRLSDYVNQRLHVQ